MTRLTTYLLLLAFLTSPLGASTEPKPFSTLTEEDHCFMNCRRENRQCDLDCRETYPKDSKEAFECVLACGDKVDERCKRRCGLDNPADNR